MYTILLKLKKKTKKGYLLVMKGITGNISTYKPLREDKSEYFHLYRK